MGPHGGRPLSLGPSGGAPVPWARALCRRHAGVDPVVLAGTVARRVAAELGDPSVVAGASGSVAAGLRLDDSADPPGGWADPWLVGVVHELAAPRGERRARGAWYTPRSVVEGLLRLALPGAALFSLGPSPVAPAMKSLPGAARSAPFSPGASSVVSSVKSPPAAGLPALVVDPTCGGGAFLLAALDVMVDEGGLTPAEALGRVAGMDVDPGAVQVSRWSLALWWLARGGGAGPVPALDLRRGDALVPWPARWRRGPVLVIGNPPFATPLKNGSIPEPAARYRAGRGDVLGPYADLAAIHLLRAVEQAAPGSTVALVQPQSVLAGRDTDGLRRHLAAAAPLRALWAAREPVFDAGVRACALVLDVLDGLDGGGGGGAAGADVVIAHGPTVTVDGARPRGSWGELAADALGAPPLPPALRTGKPGFSARGAPPVTRSVTRTGAGARLGDLATATAGFRDEHYALVAACRQAADPDGRPALPGTGAIGDPTPGAAGAGDHSSGGGGGGVGAGPGRCPEAETAVEDDHRPVARLVTVGAVDPLWTAWGTAPIRFGGRLWDRPVIDRRALPPRIDAWLERQLRPKILLATQSRLLEPCLDREGVVAPATPLIAVHAPPDQLDRVAAVLLAPPVVVWAWRRWFGTAMAIDSVKLAARQVAELPLPPDEERWAEAAARLAAGHDGSRSGALALAVDVARLMTDAYGAAPDVLDWWRRRLPTGLLRTDNATGGAPAPQNP